MTCSIIPRYQVRRAELLDSLSKPRLPSRRLQVNLNLPQINCVYKTPYYP